MDKYVGLNALRHICVLFSGDLYELGSLWLRLRKARQLSGEPKCTPTVHGLAGLLAELSGLKADSVEAIIASQGVQPGWIVDFDDFIR